MKYKFPLFLSVLFISFIVQAQKQENVLETATYQNPIIRGMNPDPTICRVGDDYYLATSTFEYFQGLPIYTSKDLVNWKLIGHALSRPENNPLMNCASGFGGQYAPTLRYHDGTFYITCTNYGGMGSRGAFYVTSTDPAGPWSDPHWVNNWAVDPSLLFANDSIYYVFPESEGFSLTTLDTVTGTFGQTPRRIADGLGGASPEGPHLYKIGDYYYLMSAEGGTGREHREVIQRSTSPWGPYESCPHNPIITHKDDPDHPFQAIGHADLVETSDGWWLVCLGIRPTDEDFHVLGRETFMAPLTWEDGWPKVGTDGTIGEAYQVPALAVHTWDEELVRDDFDTESLNLNWTFIRNPFAADWSLSERPGYLRLKGSAISYREQSSPAFIGRRQSEWAMLASSKISFTPTEANEEAGLVVRANDANQYDLLLTQFAGERVVMMRQYLGGEAVRVSYMNIADGEALLRISSNAEKYYFWVQEEGKAAVLVDSAEARNMSVESADRFTGTFVGMYASGNGAANTHPADFDWFEYEGRPEGPFDWQSGHIDSLNNMATPQIISIVSDNYDETVLTWRQVPLADGYVIERFNGSGFESAGTTSAGDTVFTDSGLSGSTTYIYRVTASNADGQSLPSIARSVQTLHAPGPFESLPYQIPGHIEAENYDYGKQNQAFYDHDEENNTGEYRNDAVDIEISWGESSSEYNISWIGAGEWLTYTVDVKDTLLDIQLRVASINPCALTLQLEGEDIATVDIPDTGGWQNWQTVDVPKVEVEKGDHQTLKVIFLNSGMNFNWMNFEKSIYSGLNEMKGQGIFISPNPVKTMARVSSKAQSLSKVEVISETGQKLGTVKASNPYGVEVDMSAYEAGVYFFRIHTRADAYVVKKVVKS